MKKLLRISALITAALMLFVMVGCGGDEEEEGDKVAPTLVSASPASGDLAANASITLTFSEKMGSVSASAGTATLGADGKTATVAPSGEWPAGALSLTISGKDVAGNDLAAAALSYTVKEADKVAPDIVADSCSPKNGASGVDPTSVSGITIVCSEAMGSVKLVSFEPADAKVDSKFDGDKTLTISFLGGYKLSNEMEIIATVEGADKAGNALKTTKYTFTTMKKEE